MILQSGERSRRISVLSPNRYFFSTVRNCINGVHTSFMMSHLFFYIYSCVSFSTKYFLYDSQFIFYIRQLITYLKINTVIISIISSQGFETETLSEPGTTYLVHMLSEHSQVILSSLYSYSVMHLTNFHHTNLDMGTGYRK